MLVCAAGSVAPEEPSSGFPIYWIRPIFPEIDLGKGRAIWPLVNMLKFAASRTPPGGRPREPEGVPYGGMLVCAAGSGAPEAPSSGFPIYLIRPISPEIDLGKGRGRWPLVSMLKF